jgi:hypothetical protein
LIAIFGFGGLISQALMDILPVTQNWLAVYFEIQAANGNFRVIHYSRWLTVNDIVILVRPACLAPAIAVQDAGRLDRVN